MSKVDIKLLKELRESTNAPLKDCKKALIEAGSDLEKAQEYLRKVGAIKAAKKSDRDTNEGIVKVKKIDNLVLGVKLACETDFVAKNEKFIEFADKVLELLKSFSTKKYSSLDDLSEDQKQKLDGMILDIIAVVGENIKIVDILKFEVNNAFIYEHPGNKIAGIVVYNSNLDNASEIAKELALQSVAMAPEYVKMEDIPEDLKSKLYNEFKAEVVDSGKPENIIENIVQGKLKKHFSSMVLLEQQWIRDESKKIKSIIPGDFDLIDVIRYSI